MNLGYIKFSIQIALTNLDINSFLQSFLFQFSTIFYVVIYVK